MGAVASAQEREQGPLGFHSSRPHNTAGLRGREPPQLPSLTSPNSAANLGSCGEGRSFRHLGGQDWEYLLAL